MRRIVACVLLVGLWACRAREAPIGSREAAAASPRRIISLIPAVSEMIYAMGAGDRLVGVSNYDRFPPDVRQLPKVGGLIDPNVERILELRPDLVMVYATQKELIERLDRAKVPYYVYQHRALPDITETIRSVGVRLGSTDPANAVASHMERSLAAIRASTASLPHPSTLLVFGRDPGSLRSVYASGGYGFLHDMLEIAGGTNVFGDVEQQSVQATTEMLLARKPEEIIELRYGERMTAEQAAQDLRVWDTLASIPAVKSHRVHLLVGDEFVVPGPRVVDATRALAHTLHPDAVQ